MCLCIYIYSHHVWIDPHHEKCSLPISCNFAIRFLHTCVPKRWGISPKIIHRPPKLQTLDRKKNTVRQLSQHKSRISP